MAIIQQNSSPFKPYARLMNILGDQLITDKIVAVIEILKNSYDADSKSAEVRFVNMSNIGFNDLPKEEQAYIEIKDYGCGMTLSTIETVWMRPATPNKFDKKSNKKATTPGGRIIQGEKGIGRFAIHKLGEKIELFTKAAGEDEIRVEMDFSEYDPDNINLFNQQGNHRLLEEVSNNWYVNEPAEEITYESGTIIRIYNLREGWKETDFKNLYKNIQRLMPPFDKNAASLGVDFKRDFNVELFVEGKPFVSKESMTFDDVIERAQYTMIGSIDAEGGIHFTYKSNVPYRVLETDFSLFDAKELTARNYVLTGIKELEKNGRTPNCGPICFTFYAFNLNKPDKTILNEELKQFIKDNFVYVLRDGLRVYPYGEKGYDWLDLDKKRSTIKAGQFISYNDLTGFVYISQDRNPLLRDASNRQGIVNTDGTFDDFKNLVTAATEIFNTEIKIDKYKVELQQKKALKQTKSNLTSAYNSFQNILSKSNDRELLESATDFVDTYSKHLELVEGRMRTVEDLAGLGMAVEKSSHDSLRLILLMRENVKSLMSKIKKKDFNVEEAITIMKDLDESLSLVYDDMQMIQPLFKIQRKAVKNVSVISCIKKVCRYFRYELDNKISTNVNELKEDIVVSTNTGIILQILINLIDNAVYWLNESKNPNKKLHFEINPAERILIVADNGNGIRNDVAPLIFDEFVSMKSDGRGLGLYIVRELLMRINAEIFVLDNCKDKILPGANFIVKFNTEEA